MPWFQPETSFLGQLLEWSITMFGFLSQKRTGSQVAPIRESSQHVDASHLNRAVTRLTALLPALVPPPPRLFSPPYRYHIPHPLQYFVFVVQHVALRDGLFTTSIIDRGLIVVSPCLAPVLWVTLGTTVLG